MKLKHLALLILAVLMPTSALAHIGADVGIHHGSAFIMGLTHSFTGLDHFSAMLTVGIWSVLAFNQSPRSRWIAPGVFAGFLLLGALPGFSGMNLPMVTPMLAASLLVFGLLVALHSHLPLFFGVLIIGAFAVFHGFAHGSELPASHAAAALSGMVLGSLILHLCGMVIAHWVLQRNIWLPRMAGGVVTMMGLGFLTGMI